MRGSWTLLAAATLAACQVSQGPIVVNPPTGNDGGGGGPTPGPSPTSAPTAVPSSPSPSPTSTPWTSPSPTTVPTLSPTPTPSEKSLLVSTTVHVAQLGPTKGINYGPFTTKAIEKNAFDDVRIGRPFRAVAVMYRDTFGVFYGRIESVQDAQGSGPHGGSLPVFFLDSTDGLSDNAGSWVFAMGRYNENNSDERVEVSATEHVTSWDPQRVASVDLGPVHRWTVWSETVERARDNSLLTGVFLVYRRPDGSRDFIIVTGAAQTIEAQGWAYAFYVSTGSLPYRQQRITFVPRQD